MQHLHRKTKQCLLGPGRQEAPKVNTEFFGCRFTYTGLMRLLHTTRLEFEEFFDQQIPPYAILSHRWGADEVSYQDFLAGRKRDGTGDKKILACCKHAVRDRSCGPVNWVWIDTCCIDKSSSAELAEAINSMFDWYQKAVICYAYLSDVEKPEREPVTESEFANSQWFTRGWTLQEMIAPQRLVFLDRKWAYIGTRGGHVDDIIAKAAKIARRRITHFERGLGKQVSVAEKFSWAAERVTSRREDQAYCLLGLFDINMPLLYGEGDRAFDRLQEEIIRSSNDESIFVWDADPTFSGRSGRVLAGSLLDFESSYVQYNNTGTYSKLYGISRAPFAITNQGLEFRVPKKLARKGRFLLPLNCLCYRDTHHIRGAFAILICLYEPESVWERFFQWSGYVPSWHTAELENLRYNATSSLYVVPVDWVWSREKLAQEETEVVYLKITH